jgi:hypothetical protein
MKAKDVVLPPGFKSQISLQEIHLTFIRMLILIYLSGNLCYKNMSGRRMGGRSPEAKRRSDEGKVEGGKGGHTAKKFKKILQIGPDLFLVL